MDDKQIIIDGIDVSECEFYIDSKNLEYNCKQTPQSYFCKNQPNCYFKQLKREEQKLINYKKQFKDDTKEMEDYQNEIIRHLESIEYWQHQVETKEQECEELKEILKEGCLHNLTLITERRVLLQTLTEIKDIAEYEFKELMNAEDYHNMTEILQQILQKINEVINGTNP